MGQSIKLDKELISTLIHNESLSFHPDEEQVAENQIEKPEAEDQNGQERPESPENAPEQQIDSQTKVPEKKSEEQTEDREIIQLPLAEGLKKEEQPKDTVDLLDGALKDSKDPKEQAVA